MITLTLAQMTYPLTVHGRAVFIVVSHEELAEMLHDRPPYAVIGDPLDDGLGFDVTQLFQGDFL